MRTAFFLAFAPLLGAATVEELARDAKLVEPFGVAFDARNNWYICEHKGERVTKVDPAGKIGILSGPDAGWFDPHGVVVAKGRIMYVADTLNNRIQQIDLRTGNLTTLAGSKEAGFAGDGGPASKARFDGTFAIALGPDDRRLYVADLRNRRVRMIDLKTGIITTIAGNGENGVPKDGAKAAESPLVDPRAVAADARGNVYILERRGNALRVVDKAGLIKTLIAPGSIQPDLNGPKHLTVDRSGNVIIADAENHLIRRYSPKDGKTITIAGTGVKGERISSNDPLQTELNRPHGVSIHPNGDLYISDSYNHRILRIR